MSTNAIKPLVIAIGNSLRQDDGIGWTFANALDARNDITVKRQYQLQVEDADTFHRHPWITVVDASMDQEIESYAWATVQRQERPNWTSHQMEPGQVLDLCRHLYDVVPQVYTLAIRGYHWQMAEKISHQAQKNIDTALVFFNDKLARTIAAHTLHSSP